MQDDKRQKVLFADDDEIVQILGKTALEDSGFELCIIGDGEEVIPQFMKFRPDIVILDVNLPKKDGITICTEIRKLPEGQLLPILMITGLDDLDAVNRCLQAGATDFESKPVNWLVLGQKIRFLIKASAMYRDHAKEMILDESHADNVEEFFSDIEEIERVDLRIIENIRVLENETGKEILDHLMESFQEEIPSFLSLIHQSNQANDYEAVKQYTFYIRTKSGNIGAKRLTRLCKELDKLIEHQVYDVVNDIVEEMDSEYLEVRDELQRLRLTTRL